MAQNQELFTKLSEAVDSIRETSDFQPKVGLVLGSGLGFLANEINAQATIPYSEIKNFPQPTVSGHEGALVLGTLEGTPVACFSGRVHMYEGLPPNDVVFSIRLLKQLGADTLILTNAAGGINTDFVPGDLMLITDHINGSGINPLVGPNIEDLGPRFPDMTFTYTPKLQDLARSVAKEQGFALKEGVYYFSLGPSYETPAEIRAFRTIGANAVGMSTVPEVIVAKHMGMDIMAISCISNAAAGILPQELSHAEVKEAANSSKASFAKLIRGILDKIDS